MKLFLLCLALVGYVACFPVADEAAKPAEVKPDVPLVIADYSSVSQDAKLSPVEPANPLAVALPATLPEKKLESSSEESSSEEKSSEEKLAPSALPATSELAKPQPIPEKKDALEALKTPAAIAEESAPTALNLNVPELPKSAESIAKEELKPEPSKIEVGRKEEPLTAAIPEEKKPELTNQLIAERITPEEIPIEKLPEQAKSVAVEAENKIVSEVKEPEAKPIETVKTVPEIPAAIVPEAEKVIEPVKVEPVVPLAEVKPALKEVVESDRVVRDAEENKPDQEQKKPEEIKPEEKKAEEPKPESLPKPAAIEELKPQEPIKKQPLPAALASDAIKLEAPKELPKEEEKKELLAEKKELETEKKLEQPKPEAPLALPAASEAKKPEELKKEPEPVKETPNAVPAVLAASDAAPEKSS